MKKRGLTKFLVIAAVLAAAAGIGWYVWKQKQAAAVPHGIAFGNGRIEATEVDVSAKQQGRVEAVLVQEGRHGEAGSVARAHGFGSASSAVAGGRGEQIKSGDFC
jgi:HlyD family secretion protein